MLDTLQEMRLLQLRRIFRKKRMEIINEFDTSFYEYFRCFFEDPPRFDDYSKFCKRIFDRTEAHGRKVLDLGCGFGLMSIHFALFGASEVLGIDLNDRRLSVFRKILSNLKPPLRNVDLKRGNEWTIDVEDESFDVILVMDTVSYVKHLDVFISEIGRVLKKNGVVFIKELNNVLNLIRTLIPWNVEKFRVYRLKTHENRLKDAVVKGYPSFSLEEFREMFDSEKNVNFETEVFLMIEKLTREQEVNPFKIKNMLENVGLRAEVIPPLRTHVATGFKGNVTSKFYSVIRFLHPFSLAIAPYFNIEAKKF